MRAVWTAAAVALGFSSAASAGVIYSFENGGPTGWSWYNTNGATSVSYSTTTGKTDGSYAARMTIANGWQVPLMGGGVPTTEFKNVPNGKLAIDITIPTAFTGDQWSIGFIVNGVNRGNIQSGTGAITTPTTFFWDYSAQNVASWPATTDFQLTVWSANGTAAQVVYFDNLRTVPVPEPTSLTLLGLPSLGLFRRRRA